MTRAVKQRTNSAKTERAKARPKAEIELRRLRATSELSFFDDPAEYEAQLRFNLNNAPHTKQTLIDYAVETKIEQQRLNGDLYYSRLQLSNLSQNIAWIVNSLATGELDIKTIKKIATEKDASQGLWALLESSERLFKRRVSEIASINGATPRKRSPAKSKLEDFRDRYVKDQGREHGWIEAAAQNFGISRKTISRIMKT